MSPYTLIGVIRFVGEQRVSLDISEQHICTVQVMRLTRCEKESCGVAQRITSGMNLATQSASGASDSFIAPPFAPAAC